MIPILIPAYEPDEKLIKLVNDLKDASLGPIVVVDDGSRNPDAIEVFERLKSLSFVTILKHAVNLGKGRALKTGINFCLNEYKDMVGCITVDSDGQHTIEDTLACVKALEENSDSLILGCRNFHEDGIPKRSSFGNNVTHTVMKLLVGLAISDTQTGLRGIPLRYMTYLMGVKGERYEFETNMLLETKEQNISIIEVPIKTIYIEENKSSHFNPIKDSARIYAMFGKFLFSSLSSAVIDIALFTLFCALLKNVITPIGIITYITISTVIARLISAAYNYAINYRVVFKSKEKISKSLIKYIILAIIQMSLSALLVNFLYPLIGGFETVVKMIVDIVLFFISYFVQRELVYKK